jgi:DNA primase
MYDIPLALTALGIDFTDHGLEALALCPTHYERTGKEDHNPSWWINLESGLHTCFSCGYKGNLLQLICDVKGFYFNGSYDYRAAESWLANAAEISIEDLQAALMAMPSYINEYAKPLEMSEARLAVFVEPPKEALDSRGITAEDAADYGVLWDAKSQTWILPLREPTSNKLMGWQEKGTVDRTFKNRPAGLQKSRTLFGTGNQNENVVVVVESPLDCLRLSAAGIRGAVAICGSSPSEDQVKLLRSAGKIIAAFDNDKAGQKASKELLEFGIKYSLNLHFFNYGSSRAKDPGDMTDEELRWGVENAISALFGESAYVQGNTQTVSS